MIVYKNRKCLYVAIFARSLYDFCILIRFKAVSLWSLTRIQELFRVDEAYAYTASESLKEETPQIYYDMNSVIVEKMFRYYKVHKSNVHNRRFFHLTVTNNIKY